MVIYSPKTVKEKLSTEKYNLYVRNAKASKFTLFSEKIQLKDIIDGCTVKRGA